MRQDLVSIIIPVYNVAAFLDECISSVVNQTYRNLEILLINDCSTDKSVQVCESWAHKDSRIKVLHNSTNLGLGLTRNEGLKLSTGNYIMFVDGDDYIEPDHVRNLLQSLIDNQADVVYGGYKKLSDIKIEPFVNMFAGRILEGDDIVRTVIPLMCGRLKLNTTDSIQMSVCMSIYANNIIQKNKIRFFSEREYISEDFLFNIDYLQKSKKVCFSDNVGYIYRYNRNSLTNTYNPRRLNKQIDMTKEIIKRTKELEIYELCEQRILATFYSWIWFLIKEAQRYSDKIGIKKSIKSIYEICNNSYVRSNISEYDFSDLPFQSRIVRILIRNKNARLLWLLAKVKNI